MMGAIRRHGPHHSAQKSITTNGWVLMNSWKCISSTFATFATFSVCSHFFCQLLLSHLPDSGELIIHDAQYTGAIHFNISDSDNRIRGLKSE